ncbi:MAG: hypothetical protein GPJ21_02150 [Microcystis aeruginosa W13-11]|jgi:hypothetical protein|nr:hypothetical protein [Microcystis aeruginosa W13-11]
MSGFLEHAFRELARHATSHVIKHAPTITREVGEKIQEITNEVGGKIQEFQRDRERKNDREIDVSQIPDVVLYELRRKKRS